MAMSDAERSKKAREKKKETIGAEAFKRLQHEAYLRRPVNLRRHLNRFTAYSNRKKYLLVSRDLRKCLYQDFADANEHISPKRRSALEKVVRNITFLMAEHDLKAVSPSLTLPEDMNIFPELETGFYLDMSLKLASSDEREVWKYLYIKLCPAKQCLYRTDDALIEDIIALTDISEPSLPVILNKLESMNLVTRSSDSNRTILKRGSAWGNENYDLSAQVLNELCKYNGIENK